MHKRIFAFIKKKYLCTLCCVEDDQPWANAFYYVFDETHHRLIYVTGEQTHHALAMQKNPKVAGTIFSPTRFNPSLQGVQFTGEAIQLFDEAKEQAKQLYQQSYQHQLIDTLSVWQVSLEYVRMIDHTLGFFSTLEWRAGEEETE